MGRARVLSALCITSLFAAAPAPAHARGPSKPAARISAEAPRRATGAEHGRPAVKNSAPPGHTELERSLQKNLDQIMERSALRSAVNGIYIVDLKTHRILYAYGEDRQLNPASNTKLVSTATALDALGPDYAYQTRLFGPEPNPDGVVDGDVYLVGSADPLLGVEDLRDLAGHLAAAGVRRITGDVIVGSDDERHGLMSSSITVTVHGADKDGDRPRVRVEPDAELFVLDNDARTSARAARGRVDVGLAAARGKGGVKLRLAVSGKIRPGEELTVTRSAPTNTLFAAHAVRAYAQAAGVDVAGTVRVLAARHAVPPAGTVLLATHRSIPLAKLAALINKPSNNFLADRLITTVGAEVVGGDPSMAKGVKAMDAWLEKIGIPTGSYRLENGSGLSHTIHISARQIMQVLAAGAGDERYGAAWVASLSIAGEDGTLARRFASRPSAGFVRGKTGTLDGVAALSGFVYDDGEPQAVAFAILTQDFGSAHKSSIRAGQADVVDAIYGFMAARQAGAAKVAPAAPGAEETPAEAEAAP